MADSKYEIRSEEVQKLMNTPINKRLLWGSTLILILLLTGVVFFNRIIITEHRSGMIYIEAASTKNVIKAIVENNEAANSLHKKIYLDIKPQPIQGYIESITPINSMNSNWIIRIEPPYDSASDLPKIVSYKLEYKKKSLFTIIKRHFGFN